MKAGVGLLGISPDAQAEQCLARAGRGLIKPTVNVRAQSGEMTFGMRQAYTRLQVQDFWLRGPTLPKRQ